jgi:hypothetical protein
METFVNPGATTGGVTMISKRGPPRSFVAEISESLREREAMGTACVNLKSAHCR